ncbi:MAG: lysophospholipid acyltransferase family protein [Clostridiaceae bacterium]|nr:lysophospholipid acyltransferase family protein [Clostridiaceae bacterium]MDY5015507.1 lysophospholipid acyltransferase family protein [Eubacteriales bacterium]
MWYRIARMICQVFFTITHHGVTARHAERLPEGAALLCPNHTSIRDPIYVAVACGSRVKLRFMAKIELFRFRPLGALIRSLGAFPVRRGEADLDAIRESLRILKEGGKLLVFPEGTRVTEGKDVEAKAGAAMLAARSGAPMVPVYIENGRSWFRRVTVTFGEPIPVVGRREEQRAAAVRVMDAIGEMKCASR